MQRRGESGEQVDARGGAPAPRLGEHTVGVVTLNEGIEMIMPGDNTTFHVHLINPIAMEKGLRFAIREGGRTVGAGVVSEIQE